MPFLTKSQKIYNKTLFNKSLSCLYFSKTGHQFCRSIKPEAQPIVILQPMGPVMFVFDVSETEEIPGAKGVKPLPPEIHKPYEVLAGKLKGQSA